jgi:hypothetical protein
MMTGFAKISKERSDDVTLSVNSTITSGISSVDDSWTFSFHSRPLTVYMAILDMSTRLTHILWSFLVPFFVSG